VSSFLTAHQHNQAIQLQCQYTRHYINSAVHRHCSRHLSSTKSYPAQSEWKWHFVCTICFLSISSSLSNENLSYFTGQTRTSSKTSVSKWKSWRITSRYWD